jgi:S1-C subfamily serine protease
MNQHLKTAIVSFVSALIAVFLYTHFVMKRVFVDEVNRAKFIAFDQFIFGRAYDSKSIDYKENQSLTAAARRSMPSVVSIKTKNESMTDFWNAESAPQTSGSGVVVSPDGYVVTNFHVVEKSKQISIITQDKEEISAVIVGSDPSTDLALLKMDKINLPFAFFGNSDSLEVGEQALAIGFPFKLDCTATAGIISAKGRNINILDSPNSIESFIQTDAIVNPGNSGGGLFNARGELIGINTAIVTQSGKYEGYSFAVPSNLVRKIVFDLKTFGRVHRGLLGVNIENINVEQAKSIGLENERGVYVSGLSPDGAAEKAGIKAGDVILSIDNIKVKSYPELQELIARYRPNEVVKIEVWRDLRKITFHITLMEQQTVSILDWGCDLRILNSEEKAKTGKNGLLILSVYRGGKMAESNIEPGFVITKINGQKATHPDQLLQIIRKADKNITLEGFYKNYEGSYYYTISK